jgi:hypothetical protein
MSLINSTAIPSGATGYEIDQSLRLEDGSAAYLNRTPSSASNRKTWTWSGWVKRGNLALGSDLQLFSTSQQSNPSFSLFFTGADKISFVYYNGTYYQNVTNAAYRDSSSWYHVVFVFDTTQSTASNRYKLYINGSLVTSYASSNYPPLNTDGTVNNNQIHYISKAGTSGTQYFDGYMAEVNFIDGTAKAPTDFGETGTYGEWKPIEYEGSYGTNGFYLNFATASDMGDDKSGNTNDWTENNIAATDQMLDSPTNNFATMNPLSKQTYTFAEGNLKLSRASGTSNTTTIGTMSVSSGKWYWEVKLVSGQSNYPRIGIFNTAKGNNHIETNYPAAANSLGARVWGSGANGATNSIFGNDNTSASFGSYDDGDVVQFALDMDNFKMYMGKNDTWYTNSSTTTAKANISDSSANAAFDAASNLDIVAGDSFTPCIFANSDAEIWVANFGQDSSFASAATAQGNTDGNSIGDFFYAPPSGFLALCSNNLPEPTVVPSEHFNTVLYTGANNTAQAITGVGFQPDFIFSKGRSHAEGGNLFDAVRGGSKMLQSHNTAAEETESAANITAFGADGFTMAADNSQYINYNGHTYVAWNWKANGSGSSNTNGSINSTVSANVDAGFSISTYTGTGSNATIGHGLSKAPEMVIVKARSEANLRWAVYHKGLNFPTDDLLYLDGDNAANQHDPTWNNTAPTSSFFSVGTYTFTNKSSQTYVAYCFHSVEGYSAVGSYIGNGGSGTSGETDGSFIYTGFRTAWVMVKQTNTANNWIITDNKRDTINPTTGWLYADLTAAEESDNGRYIDFVSNGFKIRSAGSGLNTNNGTYIYIAFGETPFKYSNGK